MYGGLVIIKLVLHIHVFLSADIEGPSDPPAKKAKVSARTPYIPHIRRCTIHIQYMRVHQVEMRDYAHYNNFQNSRLKVADLLGE